MGRAAQAAEKTEASGSELPIPASTYAGECPFAKWFKVPGPLPTGFDSWERKMLSDYEKAWVKAGSPTGIRVDDHDYDTLLGQGNTLGFVSGSLKIFEGEASTRFGLYAKAQTLPAVIGFSDFGANPSPVKFARMAVKVSLSTAWDQEVNLLFTETMEAFPTPDYAGISAFVGEGAIKGWASLIAGWIRVLRRSRYPCARLHARGFSEEVLQPAPVRPRQGSGCQVPADSASAHL